MATGAGKGRGPVIERALRVLLVEDSAPDAELIQRALRRGGLHFTVQRVEHEAPFLAALAADAPDLILADYSLPGFDGAAALHLARGRRPAVPFIFVSGTIGEVRAIEALQAGATDYVLKDHLERLVPAVRRALRDAAEGVERLRVAAELQAREAQLRLAAEQLPALLWTVDPDLRVTSLLGSRVAWLGLDPARAVGQPLADLLGVGAPVGAALAAHRAALRGESADFERLLGGASFAVRVTPLHDDDARIIGCVGLGIDIGERTAVGREIHRSNRALHTLSAGNQAVLRATDEVTLMRDVCAVATLHGDYRLAWVGFAEHDAPKSIRTVAWAGDGAGYVEGLDVSWDESERGQGPTGLAVRTGRPQIAQDLGSDLQAPPWRARMRRQGFGSSIALPLRLGDEVLGVLALYSTEQDAFELGELRLLTDLAGNLAYGLGALRTRAERRHAEEHLAVSHRALGTRTRELESKTREQDAFLYTVAHDLRAPLLSMQGMAGLLVAEYGGNLPGDTALYLARIVANAEKLQALLDELLELARVGRVDNDLEPVPLDAVVADVCAQLGHTLTARGARVDVAGPLPTVRANRARMVQLFANLIANAVHYTPPERLPLVRIAAAPHADGWELTVADNGVGIPAAYRDRVLGLFQRLPAGKALNPDGTGAGLAIVARIAETHGGTLWLDSIEGTGTTFHFTLPAAPADPEPPGPPTDAAARSETAHVPSRREGVAA